MRRLRNVLLILCISILLLLMTFNTLAAPSNLIALDTFSKVETNDRLPILVDLLLDGEASFLVVLDEQADLSAAASIAGKQAKGRFVYDTLRTVAERTQPALIAALREQGAQVRPFIIVNAIGVRGNAEALRIASASTRVARISADRPMRNALPEPEISTTRAAATTEWGVNDVHAPEVWSMGYTGTGIIVAGADTGVRWDHEALIDHYRGWTGSSADHDYNWHDAIHSAGGNPCGANTSAPCDDNNHGTHTVGTIIGDNGAGQQIGVAPGAQWIACRNMNSGAGSPTTYLECFEWFVAPYPIGGTILDGDPDQAPHIINNSWTCPFDENCLIGDEIISGVQAVRAAGILPVVSAGNSGPGCSSINSPPAIYDESFTIGAHDIDGNIASFSGRGPVTRDGSGRMKPDISAPGVGVISAMKSATNTYGSLSGTSMSGPHVAGVAALLWDAAPYLIGEVDLTEWVLRLSATPRFTTQGCGGDTSSDHPNNVWGWGAIDAQAAVSATMSQTPTAVLSASIVSSASLALFDASASYDLETAGNQLLVRWDFQNDGIWDTPWSLNKTITHTFDDVGANIAVQVADAGGLTHRASAVLFENTLYLPIVRK